MSHASLVRSRKQADDDVAPHVGQTRRQQLRRMIGNAAHLLPSQGPITVFVHHNTLHAFEDLQFEEALRQARKTYGCETYLSEDHYRECLVSGRIRHDELSAVLAEDLSDRADVMLGVLGTRFSLRMSMLEHPLQLASSAELRWAVAESDALRVFRKFVHGPTRLRMVAETRHWVIRDLRNSNGRQAEDPLTVRAKQHVRELFQLFGETNMEGWSEATWESFCLHLLWRICLDASRRVEARSEWERDLPIRHASLLEEATNEPCDLLVNELLIRFCAAFLDQGYANWRLPDRDRGFYRSFAHLYSRALGPPDRWMRGLPRELQRLEAEGMTPLDIIEESLDLLGVATSEQEAFIVATLEALPGWAGMIWQMETNAEWTLAPAPQGSLTEYLAVRLVLDRLAVTSRAQQTIGWRGELAALRDELRGRVSVRDALDVEQHAFLAFQLAQIRGWMPQELFRLPDQQWQLLMEEIECFDSFERRRILHRAYERHYRNQTLDALAIQSQCRQPLSHESSQRRHGHPGELTGSPDSIAKGEEANAGSPLPDFQIICCIDDREESFRRHLEEIAPRCETFGAAGFFGVAMYYRGASEAHPRPLCPVIIKPQHYVHEEVAFAFVKEHKRRADTRRVLGSASHQVHQGSRTFVGGALTAMGGTIASIPMVMRILFPRTTAQIRKLLGGFIRPPAVTQLTLERTESEPGADNGHLGYSVEEMTDIVERLLQDIGLTRHFAPIIVMCGHGSSSLNNPHESAYNCGACSGGQGGPNARAFAEMANDPRVREQLAQHGLSIPASSTFIGAFHNTCDDSITFYDLDRLPASHRARFEAMCESIDEARRRNAHERCRRFESASFSMSSEQALRHVEGRAEDLSQARPEYNHATDALVLVGHRWWSRNLFLDRRAFLQSYDPQQDNDYEILTRILSAVIPVCAGIGLEYYFSCVDPKVLGCGSKLPHNITSMLGVMEGAASDLRPGLSEQMIEIHEPMRMLFVVETCAEGMLAVMKRHPGIDRLVRNEWVQLSVIDPETGEVQIYQDGTFKRYQLHSASIPKLASSADWYRGWRDHLGCASIEEQQATAISGFAAHSPEPA